MDDGSEYKVVTGGGYVAVYWYKKLSGLPVELVFVQGPYAEPMLGEVRKAVWELLMALTWSTSPSLAVLSPSRFTRIRARYGDHDNPMPLTLPKEEVSPAILLREEEVNE